MGNPVVMNCTKIVMKCSSLSMILYLTRIWGKRRLRFLRRFRGSVLAASRASVAALGIFAPRKCLLGLHPKPAGSLRIRCPEAETAGERSWQLPRITGPPPGPASPTDRREGRLEHIAVEGYFPHTGSHV